MQTFAELKAELTKEIWPAGEPKSLKAPHGTFFRSAMMDIQKWVPCVRQNNVSIYPFCDTYWENGKTAVELPNGVIQRIYTIANDDWRDKVYYLSSNWREIECWAKRLFDCPTPLNTGLTKLKQGFFFAEKSTDSIVGRARIGIWAINRRRLYIAPWIQSNEKLIVEWDGLKADWLDTDGIDTKWWTQDYKEAIKMYVLERHEFHYADKKEAAAYKLDYDAKLADLMYWCREKTKQQEDETCEDFILTSAQVTDDAIPADAATSFIHAFVADWGQVGTPLDDIEEQVLALNPSLLILGGDSTYDDDPQNTPTVLYPRFSGLTKIFAFGNHDWDYDADLSEALALISQNNNERYYSFVSGPVQYFVLSTDPREPDIGYTDAVTPINGAMIGWLTAMLAISTAKWKVVVGHHSPFTSDVNNTPGNKWMRLNYKALGADLYLGGHGHNAEIIDSGGFPYSVCGLGGKAIRAFGANTDATIIAQFTGEYAFLKMVVDCSSYKITLINRHGTEIYTYEITK